MRCLEDKASLNGRLQANALRAAHAFSFSGGGAKKQVAHQLRHRAKLGVIVNKQHCSLLYMPATFTEVPFFLLKLLVLKPCSVRWTSLIFPDRRTRRW
jgi:hypothetical protein